MVEVLLINPPAGFDFGDFSIHHKGYLNYYGRTDDLVNSVIFFFLFQMTLLRWSTFSIWIPDYDSYPSLLDLFLSSDASICSKMIFSPLGKSDVVVSVSINFPSNSKWDALFHCTAYDYSWADCDGLFKEYIHLTI